MGICSLILGGGRETKESVIDPTVGLVFSKKVADPVKKGDVLATIYGNDEEKVKKVAQKLDIPYKHFAMKPLKRGFKKIEKETQIKGENIAVVGDQIFTDVLGGNRSGMFTILVEPIDNKKDYWYTAWKRPIENKIKNKIKKETNLEMQIKNILRYKMLINWSYIIGYLLVTPFICIFLYTYRHLWWLMITMFGLILAGVLTDYFLFHHVSDRIKELTHVNKELMELKKKHKE